MNSETNCLIHILLCKYIIDLKALSPLRSSTSSYENRVSKNFVFFLNFPCLSLVAYVVFVYLFVCFFWGGGVRHLCRKWLSREFRKFAFFLTPFLPRRCLSGLTKNSLSNSSDSYY